jgi:hypothetical protein
VLKFDFKVIPCSELKKGEEWFDLLATGRRI